MRWLTILLLSFLSLAGCLDSGSGDDNDPDPDPTLPDPQDEPDWARRAIFGPDYSKFGKGDPVGHDHSDRSLHNFSTSNFVELGWTPLTTGHHGMSSGGYYCGEVSTGERKLAVVNSFTSQVAMVVMDVTDPLAPELVGELVVPNAQIYDSAITADGSFAALATSPLVTTHEDGPGAGAMWKTAPIWRDACGNEFQGPEDNLPYDSGTLLVDLRDPTQPAVEDFVPQPAIGPHSVSSYHDDGTDYIVASITNLAYTASYFSVFTVDVLPAIGQGKLMPFSEYSANYENQASGSGTLPLLLNGHVDATLQVHPLTGDLLMYTANWDGGMHVVRLDGSGQTTVLAKFGERDAARPGITGAIHSAMPLGELWNGKHITITGQEVGSNLEAGEERRPTGQIAILDTTDSANPKQVAAWTIPVDFVWSGSLHFSTHYMAMVNQTLFVATYHGGLWAADASPEQWPNLPSLGVYLPANDPPGGSRTDNSYAPYVLDVLALEGGEILVYDSTSGAYTLDFLGGTADVTPAMPWENNAFIG